MTVWILELEPVQTRYTEQWQWHISEMLKERGIAYQRIVGAEDIPSATTEGAFLNFGGTNIFKSSQIETLSRHFTNGEVKDGDAVLVTDAWNPGVLQVRYMADLLGIDVKIHAIWHAGSYDPQDFLGRLIENKEWSYNAERAFFHACDHNYFATQFHIDLFKETLGIEGHDEKIHRSGLPFEYLPDLLSKWAGKEKRNLILFPHRIAPEKQPEIFDDLEAEMPEYQWVTCQRQSLTKDEYHYLLAKAKIVFSANLQETLGISAYEGALLGAMPFVPDRLSYQEMYPDIFKYPSEWTESWEAYQQNKGRLKRAIRNYMDNPLDTADLAQQLSREFFSCDALFENLAL